jgi:hypothetical protein
MNRRLVAAAIVVLTALCASFAQNARVNAIGGISIISDPINMISLPAYVNDYTDMIQATGTAAPGLGPFMAIKSFGDKLNLGIVGNQGPMLQSKFYADAVTAVNAGLDAATTPLPGTPAAPVPLPPIPHFYVGLNLDPIKLGFDLFVEYENTRYTTQTQTPALTSTTKDFGRVANAGGIANACIALGSDAYVSPLFGVSVPNIHQITTTDPGGGAATTTTEMRSVKGLTFLGGVDAGFPLLDLAWDVGGIYDYEQYQFSNVTPAGTTRGPDSPNHFFDAYAGFVKDIETDLMFAAMYEFSLGFIGIKDTGTVGGITTTTYTDTIPISHFIALGMEKSVQSVWIFDELQARAGVNMTFGQTVPKFHSKAVTAATGAATTIDSHTPSMLTVSDITPTVGLGLTKGKFQFDIVSNLAGWVGIVSGPPVLQGTVTFNFGKNPLPGCGRKVRPAEVISPTTTPATTPAPIPSPSF